MQEKVSVLHMWVGEEFQTFEARNVKNAGHNAWCMSWGQM